MPELRIRRQILRSIGSLSMSEICSSFRLVRATSATSAADLRQQSNCFPSFVLNGAADLNEFLHRAPQGQCLQSRAGKAIFDLCCFRRNGRSIRIKAKRDTPEFLEAYRAAVATLDDAPRRATNLAGHNTLRWLIEKYYGSPGFKKELRWGLPSAFIENASTSTRLTEECSVMPRR